MNSERFSPLSRLAVLAVLVAALGSVAPAQAQPTILSTVPANGATGVSTTTTIVFTFSEEMDTNATYATFYDAGFNFYNTTDSWNAANTVLTCTPDSAFALNTNISWVVSGQNTNGDSLGGFPFGSFTTGTGGGGGSGSGTNATTTFSVGKVYHYQQTSAGASTLDPTTPYGFSGVTSLSSNRTATSVSLTIVPTGAVSNLFHIPPPSAELFILSTIHTSLSTYDATFPAGNYSFFVQAATSNQTVVVSLPTTNSMPQPNAPHLTNYLAAQTVNPGQTFVLGWDAFTGGMAADQIDVDIEGGYGSPNPGLPGALTGTARTFTIPAGTLQPNTTYASSIAFFRHVGTTNANYVTAAYRATYTEFSLITSGGSQLVLTNGIKVPSNFSFDVLCPTGQLVVVEYKTNLSNISWQTLLTTNPPAAGRFHAVSPQAATNRFIFFRARI